MKKAFIFILIAALAFACIRPAFSENAADVQPNLDFWKRMQTAIESHLNRPYVWGASGLKSFDCSGFVWRVLTESGVPVKRTTARKFYMSLPAVDSNGKYRSGNIVFFDNLKHCGIVSSDRKFYHARSSAGTTQDLFDPYWRKLVVGFRAVPAPSAP
jgi:cell wall-associated NlpC family hydrolase